MTDRPPPESIRLAHLRQESGVKSIGQLCYLVAFFSLLGTVEFALFAVGVIPRDDLAKIVPSPFLDLFFAVFAVGFALNALAQIILGFGLIRLQSWARWTVVILTLISLVGGSISSLALTLSPTTTTLFRELTGQPIGDRWIGLISLILGALIHVLILWPLIANGSGVVFSNDYREMVRQTPTIKSRMHWVLKLFVGSLMMLVFGFVAYLTAIYFRVID